MRYQHTKHGKRVNPLGYCLRFFMAIYVMKWMQFSFRSTRERTWFVLKHEKKKQIKFGASTIVACSLDSRPQLKSRPYRFGFRSRETQKPFPRRNSAAFSTLLRTPSLDSSGCYLSCSWSSSRSRQSCAWKRCGSSWLRRLSTSSTHLSPKMNLFHLIS